MGSRGNWFGVAQASVLLLVPGLITGMTGTQAEIGTLDYTSNFEDFGQLIVVSRHLQFWFGMVFLFQTPEGSNTWYTTIAAVYCYALGGWDRDCLIKVDGAWAFLLFPGLSPLHHGDLGGRVRCRCQRALR